LPRPTLRADIILQSRFLAPLIKPILSTVGRDGSGTYRFDEVWNGSEAFLGVNGLITSSSSCSPNCKDWATVRRAVVKSTAFDQKRVWNIVR
jgi:hypothetical protein